ncbi:MAG TPA: conjugal transfer protein TraF [Thermoanaerobaculia bacterium]|nr:conjugal transfer protein TraF [Thermoanaerobaculia bacterium]
MTRRLLVPPAAAVLLGVVFLPAASLVAQAPMVGPRLAGMAGAATAVADDGTAVWTNPAGLARDERLDLELFGGGLATNRNDFTSAVDSLSKIDLDAIRAGDLDELSRAVRDLQVLAQPGTGVVGSGVAGLVFGKSGLALAIDDLAYAGVYPLVDLVHVAPGNDPDHSLPFNQTGIASAGLEAREVRLSYARSFFEKVLLVGATARYVDGRTYYFRQSVFDVGGSDPVGLARDALKQNPRNTSKFTFDLGAMVNILGKARVGLVSTAINEPEFTVAQDPKDPALIGSPGVIRLPRTFRAGAAVEPIGALTVAVDYDLRATDTLIPGGRSRQLSAGVEVKIPLFAFRTGAFYDFEAPDPHWAYSAGFGFGTKMISVNAAVIFSPESGLSLSSTNRRDEGAALDARVRW